MRIHAAMAALLAILATVSICHAEETKEHPLCNHTITLVMVEGEETQEFSHTFAGAKFEVAFTKGFIRFTGELQPTENGQMLLSYRFAVNDWYEDKGERVYVETGCQGELLLALDAGVHVFGGPERSFSMVLSKPENEVNGSHNRVAGD
ncbi:MAG: hypothetical protein HQ523_15695 [Lentisphaerae bacterium]|nr:hypothetical protein [Lentisphaerota bacterium]